MSVYTIGWIGFGLWFVVEEGIALYKRNVKGTLSWHIWQLFSLQGDKSELSGGEQIRRVVGFAAMAWLATHLLSGGRVL